MVFNATLNIIAVIS